jgi:glycosyltransferase involved in cell wall biosynthesis
MRILFISHDASRTGAPIILLNFLKWLKKKNSNIQFDILLLNGGELEIEFQKLTTVYYWKPQQTQTIGLKKRIINRIFFKQNNPTEQHYQQLFEIFTRNNYSMIYGNTIVTCDIIPTLQIKMPKVRVIVHVHELYDMTSRYSSRIEKIDLSNAHFIAVSDITKRNLIINHNIPQKAITLIYPFIDVQEIIKFKKPPSERPRFIVHGSGHVQVRKGYDTFIAIAKRSVEKYPKVPFHFKWIGYIPENLKFYIANDIQQSELNDVLSFDGAIDNPYLEYSKASVFLMISRQDPFPLVCLEHAILEKPIVCFDKGTGIPEFVENDAGIITPYLNIEDTVDALNKLYCDDEMCDNMGKKGGMKAVNFDINVQANKILDVIKS